MKLSDLISTDKPFLLCQETRTKIFLSSISSEGSSGTVKIPSMAVEGGTTIEDNVFVNPETLNIKCTLADTSALANRGMNAALEFLGGERDTMSVSEKVEYLKSFMALGLLVTYKGPVFSGMLTKGYDIIAGDLLISSLNISRSSSTGAAIDVSIGLKHITIAESETEDIKLPKRHRRMRKKGKTATKKVKVKVNKKVSDSTLYTAKKYWGG